MRTASGWFVVLLLGVVACNRQPPSPREEPATPLPSVGAAEPARPGPVHVAFRNVHLHVAAGVILEVQHLEGDMVGAVPGRPPNFDDQRSFILRIDSGEMAMTPASLTRLLNDYVFAYDKAPISNIEVTIDSGRLAQKGTLHKGVPIPFSMTADLSATPDGRIRLHPVTVKTAGIPSQGLMKMFGIELDDLVKSNAAHGVEIKDNDFFLSPDRLLPAPALRGHLTAARIEGDRIVEVFGGPSSSRATRAAGNYMQYRGGILRFGKLTMTDTDMDLIDADPRDPFDFSPPDYLKQLVAGYSKNTPSGGLRVFMPDYNQAAGADLRPVPTSGR